MRGAALHHHRAGIAVIGLLLLGCGENRFIAQVRRPPALPMSEPLPDLTVVVDGTETRLVDLLGPRGTLLNFWATWCVPCRREAQDLATAHRRWAGRGLRAVGVEVSGVPEEEAQAWAARWGADYVNATGLDMRTLKSLWGANGIPLTLVIDGAGIVRLALFGAHDLDGLDRAIRRTILTNTTEGPRHVLAVR
ncbi:MAG: TlpA family protein disulfide reductase [Gemmatimonadota bacterium]